MVNRTVDTVFIKRHSGTDRYRNGRKALSLRDVNFASAMIPVDKVLGRDKVNMDLQTIASADSTLFHRDRLRLPASPEGLP